jgi:hypothetical protein
MFAMKGAGKGTQNSEMEEGPLGDVNRQRNRIFTKKVPVNRKEAKVVTAHTRVIKDLDSAVIEPAFLGMPRMRFYKHRGLIYPL